MIFVIATSYNEFTPRRFDTPVHNRRMGTRLLPAIQERQTRLRECHLGDCQLERRQRKIRQGL